MRKIKSSIQAILLTAVLLIAMVGGAGTYSRQTGSTRTAPAVTIRSSVMLTDENGHEVMPAEGQFTFELWSDESGKVLQTTKNDETGQVVFEPVSHTEEGTYEYTVKQVVPEQGAERDVVYDTAEKKIVVKVTAQDVRVLDDSVPYYSVKTPELEYTMSTAVDTTGMIVFRTHEEEEKTNSRTETALKATETVDGESVKPVNETGTIEKQQAEKTGTEPEEKTPVTEKMETIPEEPSETIEPEEKAESTYQTVANPTIDEIVKNNWVKSNRYADQLLINLKKVFSYFQSEACTLNAEQKQAVVLYITGTDTEWQDSEGKTARLLAEEIILHTEEPENYNIVFFIPTEDKNSVEKGSEKKDSQGEVKSAFISGYGTVVLYDESGMEFKNTAKKTGVMRKLVPAMKDPQPPTEYVGFNDGAAKGLRFPLNMEQLYVLPYADYENATSREERIGKAEIVYCMNYYKSPPHSFSDGNLYRNKNVLYKDFKAYSFFTLIDNPTAEQLADSVDDKTYTKEELRKRLMSIALNGYPHDYSKFKGTLSDDEFRAVTQCAIWYFTDHARTKEFRGQMNPARRAVMNKLITSVLEDDVINNAHFIKLYMFDHVKYLDGNEFKNDDSLTEQNLFSVGTLDALTPSNSSLKLTKTVTGTDGETDRSFNFRINLKDKDKQAISGEFPVTAGAVAGVAEPDTKKITFDQNGTATVQLKHGQTIQIDKLPDGFFYSVEETESNTEGYTTTSENASNIDEANGVYETVNVSFTNLRDIPTPESILVPITAEKILEGGNLVAGQFSFELRDNDGKLLQTKTNDATGFIQFEPLQLQEGKYTYFIKEMVDSQANNGNIIFDSILYKAEVSVENVQGKLISNVIYSSVSFPQEEERILGYHTDDSIIAEGYGTPNLYVITDDKFNALNIDKQKLPDRLDADKEKNSEVQRLMAESLVAYCYNKSWATPEVIHNQLPSCDTFYQSMQANPLTEALSNNTGIISEEALRSRLLYIGLNGYPANFSNFKGDLTDDEFRAVTQYAIWYYSENNRQHLGESGKIDQRLVSVFDKLISGNYSAEMSEMIPSFIAIYKPNKQGIALNQNLLTVGLKITKAEKAVFKNRINPTINIPVTKQWVGENAANVPDTITVKLYANGEPVDGQQIILKKSSGWVGSFQNLHVLDEKGNNIEYTVQEGDIPANYSVEYKGNSRDGFTIINTKRGSDLVIKVQKTFNGLIPGDNYNQKFRFELKGGNLTVPLYATNNAQGIVEFPAIPFSDLDSGDNFFYVKEIKGDDEDIEYDSSTYRITVKVAQDSTMTQVVHKLGAESVNDTNEYDASIATISNNNYILSINDNNQTVYCLDSTIDWTDNNIKKTGYKKLGNVSENDIKQYSRIQSKDDILKVLHNGFPYNTNYPYGLFPDQLRAVTQVAIWYFADDVGSNAIGKTTDADKWDAIKTDIGRYTGKFPANLWTFWGSPDESMYKALADLTGATVYLGPGSGYYNGEEKFNALVTPDNLNINLYYLSDNNAQSLLGVGQIDDNLWQVTGAEVSFSNKTKEKPTGSFILQKVDGGGDALNGDFRFTLFKDVNEKDPVEGFQEVKIGDDGKISFQQLPYGIYYLKETNAPDDYAKLNRSIKIQIDGNGVTVYEGDTPSSESRNNGREWTFDKDSSTLKVKNYKWIQAPETGSRSQFYVYGLGLLLLIAGMLIMIKSYERSKVVSKK